jgi:hypothetical protein
MKNAILAILLLGIFPLAPFVMLGCVATSRHVDNLTQKQADTADILANLADLHADLAEELQSMQAATARKTAFYAKQNADEAIDLSNESSGVNIAPIVKGALSGNWIEVIMGLATTAGLAFGAQQNRKAKRFQNVATCNANLVDEVAELEPVVARQVAKAKKQA